MRKSRGLVGQAASAGAGVGGSLDPELSRLLLSTCQDFEGEVTEVPQASLNPSKSTSPPRTASVLMGSLPLSQLSISVSSYYFFFIFYFLLSALPGERNGVLSQ